MSSDAMLWGIHGAPTATVNEFAVVMALGERADPDGCGAFPSRAWLAERTKLDSKVVQRTLGELNRRGIIVEGDQARAAYIRADRRPPVWDMQIPASWYSSDRLAKVNRDRMANGLEPLTDKNRPPLAPAPEKPKRADAGKKRASTADPADDVERGDYKSPRENPRGDSETPREGPRGVYKSFTGGLQVPHGGSTRPPNLKEEPKEEPLSRSGASIPTDRPGVEDRERDLDGAETDDPAGVQKVVAEWTAARGPAGVPPFAPANVARSAREMLAEGVAVGTLCAAAVVMAPKGWTDFRKHLEHWSVPGQRVGDISIVRASAISGCDQCDEGGWRYSDRGRHVLAVPAVRCAHPIEHAKETAA